MNKTELVKAVVAEADVSVADATKVVNALFEVVAKTLEKKEEVVLVGFGTFKTADRAARTARNPQTGEAIEIPATTVPVFKVSKALKDRVK